MAYVDVYNAAIDTAIFQPKCMAALWSIAVDILNESVGTPNHTARVAYATRVLQDELRISAKQIAVQALRDATIASNPGAASDAAIKNQLVAVLSDLMTLG